MSEPVKYRSLYRWAVPIALLVAVAGVAVEASSSGRSAGQAATVAFEVGGQISLTVGDVGVQGFRLRDLNGDALADLVAIDQFAGGVSILINQGNATFAAPMSVTLEVLPTAVAVEDFSGDGVPEIAVTDFDGGVSLLQQDDAGNYQLIDEIDPGVELIGIATGDLDGDDDLDMILLETADEVVLQQNDGFGNFECFDEDLFDTEGEDPVDVDVGDFNRDGVLDLVVLNRSSEDVSLLLGQTDGVFTDAALYPVGQDPRDLAVGRVDADDIDDLIVIESGISGEDNITVLLGRTDGVFARPPKALAEVFSSAVGLGDFDDDGCQDVLAASEEASNAVVALGDCTGGFAAPLATAEVGRSRALDVADLNADGKADFMVLETLGERLRPALNQTAPPLVCPGDCDGGGDVAINELVIGVNIVLERFEVRACAAADVGNDGVVTIDELVRAVRAALDGCPEA